MTKPALTLVDRPEPLAEPQAPQRLSKRQHRRAAAKAARKQHKAAMRAQNAPVAAATLQSAAPQLVEETQVVQETAGPAPVEEVLLDAEFEPEADLDILVDADPEPIPADAPLPRNRALAVHRSRGPLSVIGAWTRAAMRSLTPRRPERLPEQSAAEHLAALRLEVARLQASLDRYAEKLAA